MGIQISNIILSSIPQSTKMSTTTPQHHLTQLQTLLTRGYTSQLLFSPQLPLSLKIPALISCKMYDQAISQLLKEEQLASPLHTLWLVICMYMVGAQYGDYYGMLGKGKGKGEGEGKYRELADDWVKMYKPVNHPVEVRTVMRKKFQQLLLLAQQQNYFTTPKMPVFLLPCSWLQKFYNSNIPFIPPIDPSPLANPMPLVQTQPKLLHYTYSLKSTVKQNIDYKIIPYQAWQYLWTNFGGMEFRRFTTNQKEPICELSYTEVRVLVVWDRAVYGMGMGEGEDKGEGYRMLAGRFDTIASVVDRVKRIMVAYRQIEFEGLSNVWEPVLVSHLAVDDFIDIIQDQQQDLIKQSTPNSFQLSRLQYTHDIQDSQYNPKTDFLLFLLHKPPNPPSIDIHSIPYKKTLKTHNKCQTCSTTENLEQCPCRQVYFCCKECRAKNKEHLKICATLMKEDKIVDRLVEFYGVGRRQFGFGELKKGGKVGLENLGNTCYMNAALQCVLGVDVLNQFFVSNQHVKQLNVTNVLGSFGQLACAYGQLVKDYYTTNRRALEPIKILKIISGKNAQFRGHNHQDSQQFFNYFFDKLHEDLNRIRDKPYIQNIESDGRPDPIVSDLSWRNYLKRNNSFISDNFAGQYRSEIRCPDCTRISITFDPFLSVTLPFPRQEAQEELIGYFLGHQGGFQKVERKVKASMAGEEFLEKYFHEPVHALWLRKKQPESQWKLKRSISHNNNSKGVLIFYPKPSNATVQIQPSFEGYQIFHRKIFTTQINSVDDLMRILYRGIKTPLLKATKDEELLKIDTEEYLKKCMEAGFMEISGGSVKQYPVEKGTIAVKVKLNLNRVPWPLKDKIKFDISSKLYEPKPDFKLCRSIQDQLSIPELLESFSQPEQLTEQNSWYCNKCKDHKLAHKIMSVYKTAKYLVIHLKRFNHRGNRYIIYGEKVRTPIKLSKIERINGQDYQLFGVVNHYGSLSMGHYTAFVKRDGDWYDADDSSFKRRDFDGRDAYLLFYKRVQ